MTTTTHPRTPAEHRRRLSPQLVSLAATALALGLGAGGLISLERSPRQDVASAAAWPPHLALAGLALALVVIGLRRRRRSGGAAGPLLAPLGASAWHRMCRTVRVAPGRALIAAPLGALLLYDVFRAGVQVLGGLDPNFTADAWGGPSYAGAMFCHFLDLALLSGAAAWLLDRVLVGRSARATRARRSPHRTTHRDLPR